MAGAVDLAAVKARSEAAARAAEAPAPAAGAYVVAGHRGQLPERDPRPVVPGAGAARRHLGARRRRAAPMVERARGDRERGQRRDRARQGRRRHRHAGRAGPAGAGRPDRVRGDRRPARPRLRGRAARRPVARVHRRGAAGGGAGRPAGRRRRAARRRRGDATSPPSRRCPRIHASTPPRRRSPTATTPGARERFQAILDAEPANAAAALALHQVDLLARVDGARRRARPTRPPTTSPGQLGRGRPRVRRGDADAALRRLLDLLARTAGDDRETVRQRLIEYFELLGPDDPRVGPARREMARALF